MADIVNYENREKVMAKGNFQPEIKAGYGGDVLGMLFSVFLIIGGLSGRMVLRFTNSSPALVVAGFVFLAWDIFALFKKKSNIQKAEEERYARGSRMYDLENAVKKDGRALSAPIPVRIACDKRLVALDFDPRLNGGGMTRDIKACEYTGASARVRNVLYFNNIDLSVVFEVDPYASEVVLDLFRNKTGIGIALPDNAKLVSMDGE